MQDLKEVLYRIRDTKLEKRKINEIFRDAFAQSKSYQEVLEQIKALKAKKVQLEHDIRNEFVSEIEKMDKLANGIKSDGQLLSDLAMSKMMKGESIEIKEDDGTTYEPVIKVTFKKTM